MLNIKEWTTRKDCQLGCGHSLKAGETGYIITLFVCANDAACLPQAIRACFAAQKAQAEKEWKPPLLYRLWHAWFGRRKASPDDRG